MYVYKLLVKYNTYSQKQNNQKIIDFLCVFLYNEQFINYFYTYGLAKIIFTI